MKNMKHTTFGVIGLGRFGTALAKSLAEAGKEVIVVDCNESKVRGAAALYGARICGRGSVKGDAGGYGNTEL